MLQLKDAISEHSLYPVFIGATWPSISNLFDISQVMVWQKADVLARYFRQRGHPVLYISGMTCDLQKGKADQRTDIHHASFSDAFDRLGLSFDAFGQTDRLPLKNQVQSVFRSLEQKGMIQKSEGGRLYLNPILIQHHTCLQTSQAIRDGLPLSTCDVALGFLAESQIWAEQAGQNWRIFWQEPARFFAVHGKEDPSLFTTILPILVTGFDESLKGPDRIVSCQSVIMKKRGRSASHRQISEVFDWPADVLRFYLLSQTSKKRDTFFSAESLVLACKSLANHFGNFVHRTFSFLLQYRDGCTPNEPCDPVIQAAISSAYLNCADLLEKAEIQKALNEIFRLVHQMNVYIDRKKPWLTVYDDPDVCDQTLATCLHAIVNLSQLLYPFLPFSCRKIRTDLSLSNCDLGWSYVHCPCGRLIFEAKPLFPRIKTNQIATFESIFQSESSGSPIDKSMR